MNDTHTDNDVTFESFAVSLGATGAALVAIFTAFAILRIIVPALYITRYLGSTIDAEPLEPYRYVADVYLRVCLEITPT